MEDFTPWSSLAGGALIGLSATLLYLGNGRIAGISGICGGLLRPAAGDVSWRIWFLLGLIGGAGIYAVLVPLPFEHRSEWPPALLAAAGVLVGFGTRLGSGCTSGHGICGMARLSPRSITATVTFLVVGLLTASLVTSRLTGA